MNQIDNDIFDFDNIEKDLRSLPEKELPPYFHSNMMSKLNTLKEGDKARKWSNVLNILTPKVLGVAASFALLTAIIVQTGIINTNKNEENLLMKSSQPDMAMFKDEMVSGGASNSISSKETINKNDTNTKNEKSLAKKAETSENVIADDLNKKETTSNMMAADSKEIANKEKEAIIEETPSMKKSVAPEAGNLIEEKMVVNSDNDTADTNQPRSLVMFAAAPPLMDVKLQNTDFDSAMNTIKSVVSENGGYVDSTDISTYEPDPDKKETLKEASIIVKISVDKYENLKAKLNEIGKSIELIKTQGNSSPGYSGNANNEELQTITIELKEVK